MFFNTVMSRFYVKASYVMSIFLLLFGFVSLGAGCSPELETKTDPMVFEGTPKQPKVQKGSLDGTPKDDPTLKALNVTTGTTSKDDITKAKPSLDVTTGTTSKDDITKAKPTLTQDDKASCIGFRYKTCAVDSECRNDETCVFPTSPACVASKCVCEAKTGKIKCTMDCLFYMGVCHKK